MSYEGRSPYKYRFRDCAHRDSAGRLNVHFEQGLGYSCFVCNSCNIIVPNAERQGARRPSLRGDRDAPRNA